MYVQQSVDNTLLPVLNAISQKQAKATNQTEDECLRILDYVDTYPYFYSRYHAGDMVLNIDYDA